MPMKSWALPQSNPRLAAMLASSCDLPLINAEILVNRGLQSERRVLDFLNSSAEYEDPFLLADMETAVSLVQQAIDEGLPITIYGDYDCDGVTSTAMLDIYLSALGAEVDYYIPSRLTEGYGMNVHAVRALAERGTKLIVTVDNGISAHEEIALAKKLGMQVVVTDHHQVGEQLPPADAVINPHRTDCPSSFKDLAGVGVAFKFIVAMEGGDYEGCMEQFGDLLALGTIGDLVPLVGENRSLVQEGLQILRTGQNLGLMTLMEQASIHPEHIKAQQVAFGLSPRINAAGRVDDASLAVNLLLTDSSEEALALAQKLEALNLLRKQQEQHINEEIEQQIAAHPESLYDRLLTYYGEGWPHGVIGIVSSRILEQYGKPNLLMEEENGLLIGSARSVADFSLYRALSACSDRLIRYGGHTQAAGFTLKKEDFPVFKQQLEDYAREHYRVMPAFSYPVDKELVPADLTVENLQNLSLLEPFGTGNQEPVFLMRGCTLLDMTPLSEGRHLRLRLRFGSQTVTALYWQMNAEAFGYLPNSKLDFLVRLSLNHYREMVTVQAEVLDVHPVSFDQQAYQNALAAYEMFCRKEPLPKAVLSRMQVSRDDAAAVYRTLRKTNGMAMDADRYYYCYLAKQINYCQYRLILDILMEAGLLRKLTQAEGYQLVAPAQKADLTKTATMQRLQQGSPKKE